MLYQSLGLFILPCLVSVSWTRSCPDPDLDRKWQVKDRSCRGQNNRYRYHCQYDVGTDIITDLCATPQQCTPGTRPKLDIYRKTVICVPCSSSMYQPVERISYRFTQPNCDRHVRPCSTGETQCGAPTASQNYMCKCDHTQGMRPNNIVHECDCFNKDTSICQCLEGSCEPEEQVAKNYSCVKRIGNRISSGALSKLDTTQRTAKTTTTTLTSMTTTTRASETTPSSAETTPSSAETYTTTDQPVDRSHVWLVIRVTVPVVSIIALTVLTTTLCFCWRKQCYCQTRSDSSSEAGPQTVSGNELYNRVKGVFGETADPAQLIMYLPLGPREEERVLAHCESKGRVEGAAFLLRTLKRTVPNWYEAVLSALRENTVAMHHLAHDLEAIRNGVNSLQKGPSLNKNVDVPPRAADELCDEMSEEHYLLPQPRQLPTAPPIASETFGWFAHRSPTDYIQPVAEFTRASNNRQGQSSAYNYQYHGQVQYGKNQYLTVTSQRGQTSPDTSHLEARDLSKRCLGSSDTGQRRSHNSEESNQEGLEMEAGYASDGQESLHEYHYPDNY